jgi:hypothetical protein
MSDWCRILFRAAIGVVWRAAGPCLVVFVLVQLWGCSRSQYRTQADADALSILDEKTQEPQWSPPLTYSIEPSRDSRLFDPSPTDDPILPDARPRLHAYEIPIGIGRRSAPSSEVSSLTPTDAGPWVLHASHSADKSATGRILLARYATQNDHRKSSKLNR